MGILDGIRRDRRFKAARALLDAGDLAGAEAAWTAYLADDPGHPAAWWNLGLVYKFGRRWQESIDAFKRSADIAPGEESFWNIGVAATALRDWPTARWAWRRLDFDVGPGDGPPEGDFGPGPVRLNPEGAAEVVWGRRIDPCRMRLESVPLPESGHRWADVVLHDVVPRGKRQMGDRALAVFDELERMDPSHHPTHRAELSWSVAGDESELAELLDAGGMAGENWTSSVQMVCATCSLADAHVHPTGGPEEVQLTGTWGLAGETAALQAALDRWSSAGPGRAASPIKVVL